MRAEGREILLDALTVADINEHTVKDRNTAAVRSGDHQAAHRHRGQQADGLERDGLAARVRAGDDQRPVVFSELQCDRHDGLGIEQRMPRLFQQHRAVIGHLRNDALLHRAERRLCKAEIQLRGDLIAGKQRRSRGAAGSGELCDDALGLLLLLAFQQADIVVRVHNRHRLDEIGLTGRGGVVDQAGDFSAVFRLDGNDIASVADRDDRLLQISLHRGRFQHLFELFAQSEPRLRDLFPDRGQLGACRIRKPLLVLDRTLQQIGEIGIGLQARKKIRKRIFDLTAVVIPVGQRGDLTLQPRDLQQFLQRDARA